MNATVTSTVAARAYITIARFHLQAARLATTSEGVSIAVVQVLDATDNAVKLCSSVLTEARDVTNAAVALHLDTCDRDSAAP